LSGKVFINYRRDDDQGNAGRLYDRLEAELGGGRLFMDVEGHIKGGEDFVDVLIAHVAACDVLLAIIGPRWLTIADEDGRRRLDNPDDWVRIEIAGALEAGKRVMPVLVGGAEMPRAEDLPEPLKPLARRQAVRVAPERFRSDALSLVRQVKMALAEVGQVRDTLPTAGANQRAPGGIAATEQQRAREFSRRAWLAVAATGTVALSVGGIAALTTYGPRMLVSWLMDDRSIRTFTGHKSAVNAVALAPDGRTVVSGSSDHTLKLWDVAAGKELHTFTGHGSEVSTVAFAPDGRTALSASYGETPKLWDVATGKQLSFFVDAAHINSIAFAPDGRTAISGGYDGLKLWDLATGRASRTSIGSAVIGVAFSPDGRAALLGGATLRLWDVAAARLLRTFNGHASTVSAVAFASDGRTALSGSDDRTLKLWDVATGKELRSFTGHTSKVGAVAFAPDGRTVLSGSNDSTLMLWDVATGRRLRTFAGHFAPVYAVAFSPDGRTALSGSADRTLMLWDVAVTRDAEAATQ
jgi:WD40 repeat protein